MPADTATVPPRYRDPKLFARGAMGDVYCAVDTLLGRPVALKLLAERYAADAEIRSRFTREALAAARLSGVPHIVTIYDVGETDGQPYIVMEYLPNGSLEDVLQREGAQPAARALEWLEEAARALDAAHEHGVVHRDVKPANLLLDSEGRLHVADFGVASAAGLESLTVTGTILGTAGYLAPEQAEGKPSGPASDRYALGIVGFQLLTGTRPFQRESAAAEASAHVHEPVPSASERHPGVPREADAIFHRALAKRPSERYTSCGEFVAALRAAYAAGAGTTRILRPGATGRRRSPVPLALGLAALALAGGIAAAVVTTGGGGNHRGARVIVTEHGPTLSETVTVRRPPLAPPPTVPTTSTSTPSSSGTALALLGYRRLQAGDAAGALPLLQSAAQKLRGTGSLEEAYNDYNLAVALTKTEGCSPQVLQLLAASEDIQGHRSEIDNLRTACRKRSGR